MELTPNSPKRSAKLPKPFACEHEDCGKSFTRAEHLRRHVLNHSRPQTWRCKTCGMSFVRKDLWRRHWRVRHQGQEPPEESAADADDVSSIAIDRNGPTCAPNLRDHGSRAPVDNMSTPSQYKNMEGVPYHNMDADPELAALQDYRDRETWRIGDQTNGDPVSHDYMYGSWKDWFPIDDTCQPLDNGVDLSWMFNRPSDHDIFNPSRESHETPAIDLTLHDYPASSPGQSSVDGDHSNGISYIHRLKAPTCGYRVCSALSMQHRKDLLSMLGTNVAEIDPNILTLHSLQHGIHLFGRFVAKEYPILHNQLMVPWGQYKSLLEHRFGLESSPELTWAVITFGWSSLDHRKYQPYHQAADTIQGVLRQRIISHSSLTFRPPLWLIQTLFFCLTYARYHGNGREYRFGSLFHGVLIDLVRRVEVTEQDPLAIDLDLDEEGLMHAWFSWIKDQTIKRIIFQTFILDIQHAFLHGDDVSFSPFSINYCLPETDDAWFAPTLDRWLRVHEAQSSRPSKFLASLRTFWNSSSLDPAPVTFPRGSKVLMYGVLSIAYDMRRRDDNSFSPQGQYSLESLGTRVKKSFEKWLQWWNQTYNNPQMETVHLWRNCACLYRLGHTLYEISATEWRTIAGVDVMDGRSVGAMDYIRAKRKVKAWAKQERARIGLAYAATIIEERLSASHKPEVHCEHCSWCLYLAGLICWGYGFVTQGHGAGSHISRLRDPDSAKSECNDYLAAVTQSDLNVSTEVFNKTTGLLLELIRLSDGSGDRGGLLEESLAVLKRLAGPNYVNAVDQGT